MVFHMLTEMELITRLIIAVVLGSLIGLEREFTKGKYAAGLRTHAIVCLGAALFTVVSISFLGESNPARIAAGIVTGIGFIGAGLIFKETDHVRGLTSAANIWTVAAVGIAVGIGYYFAAVVATILMLLILIVGRFFEKKFLEKKPFSEKGLSKT